MPFRLQPIHQSTTLSPSSTAKAVFQYLTGSRETRHAHHTDTPTTAKAVIQCLAEPREIVSRSSHQCTNNQPNTTAQQSSNTSAEPREIVSRSTHTCTNNPARLHSRRSIPRLNLGNLCHDQRTHAPTTQHDCAAIVQYLG